LKYKRIKRIAFLGNADRCLVMRNVYARKMIDLVHSGKTIWNYDESFIKDTFFIRKKWCQSGNSNSVPNQSVRPRISVLLAMNNHGEAYISLS
jgi:hypothetical protein